MTKKVRLASLGFLGSLVIIFVLVTGRINRMPLEDQQSFTELDLILDTVNYQKYPSDSLGVGWSKVNITPDTGTFLAGFGRRGPHTAVHDSLYARVVVFDNGRVSIGVISLDLLMFPRSLADKFKDESMLHSLPVDHLFFSAIHTHQGFGQWDPSRLGNLAFGPYDEQLVNNLSAKITQSIREASGDLKSANLRFHKVAAPNFVANRVDEQRGLVDAFIRAVEINRSDGSKGYMISYAAHPVNIDANRWILSRDYPGVMVDELEEKYHANFAVFLAGMVGSHRTAGTDLKDFNRTDYLGSNLASLVIKDSLSGADFENYDMLFADIKLPIQKSHMRISKNLQVRDWVFRYLLGPIRGNIQVLRIGELLMLGMPCDFSGEIAVGEKLDAHATEQGMDLMITSFNGNYIGYITADNHYETSTHDEVRILNWVGPHKGQYFTTAIKKIIQDVDQLPYSD